MFEKEIKFKVGESRGWVANVQKIKFGEYEKERLRFQFKKEGIENDN